MLEFAMIALVLYFILAAILEFGRATFAAQVVTQAADTAARELARLPLPAGIHLRDALQWKNELGEIPAERVFKETALVIEMSGKTPEQAFAELPLVNQQLWPLMVPDKIGGKDYLRYPGAVVVDPESSEFLVLIPRIVGRDENGVETIDWLPVLEEIKPEGVAEGRFAFQPQLPQQSGRVFLRINYPFQAASLSAYRQSGMPPKNDPVYAEDGRVEQATPAPGSLIASDLANWTYSGPYGLGQQLALGQTLRPFRRVISGQSGSYAREILLPDSGEAP